jgi:predicted amidophosphoribosyltransferase
MTPCSNCQKKPVVAEDLCAGCKKEADKAHKVSQDINNAMEANGIKLRFHEDLVRMHLLKLAREGKKSDS